MTTTSPTPSNNTPTSNGPISIIVDKEGQYGTSYRFRRDGKALYVSFSGFIHYGDYKTTYNSARMQVNDNIPDYYTGTDKQRLALAAKIEHGFDETSNLLADAAEAHETREDISSYVFVPPISEGKITANFKSGKVNAAIKGLDKKITKYPSLDMADYVEVVRNKSFFAMVSGYIRAFQKKQEGVVNMVVELTKFTLVELDRPEATPVTHEEDFDEAEDLGF